VLRPAALSLHLDAAPGSPEVPSLSTKPSLRPIQSSHCVADPGVFHLSKACFQVSWCISYAVEEITNLFDCFQEPGR